MGLCWRVHSISFVLLFWPKPLGFFTFPAYAKPTPAEAIVLYTALTASLGRHPSHPRLPAAAAWEDVPWLRAAAGRPCQVSPPESSPPAHRRQAVPTLCREPTALCLGLPVPCLAGVQQRGGKLQGSLWEGPGSAAAQACFSLPADGELVCALAEREHSDKKDVDPNAGRFVRYQFTPAFLRLRQVGAT